MAFRSPLSGDHAVPIALDVPVTDQNFDEVRYLKANPDVAAAVKRGALPGGTHHYEHHGKFEGRSIRLEASVIKDAMRRKMDRVRPLLDLTMAHERRGEKYDFLTPELRKETGIADTENISAWNYDIHSSKLIKELGEGIALDCGAGRRPVYYENVVNYEIVDYDTTDIVGVGEKLPFKDGSFDLVLSLAVLEHVRDPFACARELIRVLKPGGTMLCAVPFLQPEHGYPHHYYNMAPQGLRALFERDLHIQDQILFSRPIYTLRWFLSSWVAGLDGDAKKEFLSKTISDIIAPMPDDEIQKQSFVQALSKEKNFELACATAVIARKPY
jgi:SAM-dependent methyltransferase